MIYVESVFTRKHQISEMAPLWEILTLLKKSALACITLPPTKTTQALQGLCFGRVSVPYLRGRSISFNYPF